MSLFVDTTTPYLFYDRPHSRDYVDVLLALSDGSIVSGSERGEVNRWAITKYDDDDNNNNNEGDNCDRLQLVGTFIGHESYVSGMIERAISKNDRTLVTGSYDGTLKVWNIKTCQNLSTVRASPGVVITCMIKTKCDMMLVCGNGGGTVEIRRLTKFRAFVSCGMSHY